MIHVEDHAAHCLMARGIIKIYFSNIIAFRRLWVKKNRHSQTVLAVLVMSHSRSTGLDHASVSAHLSHTHSVPVSIPLLPDDGEVCPRVPLHAHAQPEAFNASAIMGMNSKVNVLRPLPL